MVALQVRPERFDRRQRAGRQAGLGQGCMEGRGFGELVWTFRVRGAPGEQTRSVYVATRREGGDWRPPGPRWRGAGGGGESSSALFCAACSAVCAMALPSL